MISTIRPRSNHPRANLPRCLAASSVPADAVMRRDVAASQQRTHGRRTTDAFHMIQANTPHKPRLVILDEDRIILQSLGQFLRREGYDVRTFDQPELALAHLE